jgi:diguanylate cyclase (GGDEF)-like protein/PAS domain S-box-containing protein
MVSKAQAQGREARAKGVARHSLQDPATLRELVGNLREGVYVSDLQGRILDANPAFLRMFGLASLDELARYSVYDLMADPAQRAAELELLARDGAVREFEIQIRRPDGQERTVLDACHAAVDPQTGETLFHGILVDITDRKEEEARLEQWFSLLRATLESTADGILVVDHKGRIVSFNQKFATTWKIPGEILVAGDDRRALEFVRDHVKHPVQFLAKVEELYADPDATSSDIIELKDGRVFERYSQPQKVGGRSVGRVWSFRDISERDKAEVALRESEERYRRLVELSPDGIGVYVDGRIVFVNAAGAKIFGAASAEQLIGKQVMDLVHPSFRAEVSERMRVMLHEDRQVPLVAETFLRLDGTPVDVEVMAAPLRYGDRKAIQVVVRDMTERRRQELALRESEERYALAAQGANDGLWDWHLFTNEVYYSPRWKEMLGLGDVEVSTSLDEWLKRVHPEDVGALKVEIATHTAGITHHLQDEHRIMHKDGGYRWVLCRGVAERDAAGKAYRMAGSLTDITERKLAEEQLLHDAFHDSLTNLANRALFTDLLGRSLGRAQRRADYRFAVLFIDLDRFKVVNDSLGHTVGDELLRAITRRIERCVRPGDTVARLGGDEFTILVDDIGDASDATRVADRIQRELTQPFNLSGHEVFTSASIGIALSASGYEEADDVLRDADIAMYRAKALGKARYEVFDTAMHARAMALLELETDLRRAIERNEFRLYYQPMVNLETGRIVGFEGLVRWQHPQRGLIGPAAFVPIAEETGLIIPIGRWVLKEACRQMREWQERYPGTRDLTISVNLSGKQFAQARLVEDVDQALKESGLAPGRLRLEITESVVMENAASAMAMIDQLRGLNVKIDIDDFGTGYSSLSYLQRFEVDHLKIDRSFVSNIGSDRGENAEIVRTIVTLAHHLGMDAVAEGVETQDQLRMLRDLGCGSVQGFLFAEPVSQDEAEGLLKDDAPLVRTDS